VSQLQHSRWADQDLLERTHQLLDRCYQARLANYMLRSKRHQLRMVMCTEYQQLKLVLELEKLERLQ
jgi:hypothetical protein